MWEEDDVLTLGGLKLVRWGIGEEEEMINRRVRRLVLSKPLCKKPPSISVMNIGTFT